MTRNFPLILTICNFCFLENHIRYKGQEYETKPYRKGQDQDIETEGSKLKCPTIFHLFGYIGQDRTVVITEDDFLSYLHFIQDTNSRPKKLKEYLEGKYILSLGCDIPDWTFRFLLYSLKEVNGQLKGSGDEKTFDGGALSKTIDEDLACFLSDISYFSDNDLNAFLKDVNSSLTSVEKPTIFLSVNSAEYDTLGVKLMEILEPLFKVWLFKYKGGSQYWEDIRKGISECDYFIPVTTNLSIDKFFDESSKEDVKDIQPGIVTELRMALEHRNKFRGKDKFCFPYVPDVPESLLKRALQNGCCNDLWPLFYSNEGNEHITIPLADLTAEKVWNHIMK